MRATAAAAARTPLGCAAIRLHAAAPRRAAATFPRGAEVCAALPRLTGWAECG